jgi:hypothetical protein
MSFCTTHAIDLTFLPGFYEKASNGSERNLDNGSIDLMTNAKATVHEIGLHSLLIGRIRVEMRMFVKLGYNCDT